MLDRAGFEAFVRRRGRDLWRSAWLLTGDGERAEIWSRPRSPRPSRATTSERPHVRGLCPHHDLPHVRLVVAASLDG